MIGDKTDTLKHPWTCIYRKHVSDDFDKWYKNHSALLRENPKKLLYGAFIKTKRISLWFAHHGQLVQKISISRPASTSAPMSAHSDTGNSKCFVWSGNEWSEFTGNEACCRKCSYLDENDRHNKTISKRISAFASASNVAHKYPFALTTEKIDTDRFFELLTGKGLADFTRTMKETEVPSSPLLFVEDENIESMKNILNDYSKLTGELNNNGFPRHLQSIFNKTDYKFELSPPESIPFNLVCGRNTLLISFIDDENDAMKYLDKLKNDSHKSLSELDFLRSVTILMWDNDLNAHKFIPKISVDRTKGDAEDNIKNIAYGG